jgi:hypothetical protein
MVSTVNSRAIFLAAACVGAIAVASCTSGGLDHGYRVDAQGPYRLGWRQFPA